MYYFGARYYDPLTGRFTTRDTILGGLGDPQSQNRYVYCRNNPHKYVDPDGSDYVPSEEINQLMNLASQLSPEQAALLVIAGTTIYVTSRIKQEAEKGIKAEISGRYDQIEYLFENDWDREGSFTHYKIGKQASYASSHLGSLGGGVKGAVKRRLQQKAFLDNKPGIDQYPPNYTEEDFLLDTFSGMYKPKSYDPDVYLLTKAFDDILGILNNHIRNEWYEATSQINLSVPPDYVDASFR